MDGRARGAPGQSAGLAQDYGPLPVGRGLSLPLRTEVAGSPPWWAMVFALVADATIFASLVFGTLYLWISAPNWPPATAPEPDLRLMLAAVTGLVVAALAAGGSLRAGTGGAPQGWIALGLLALLSASPTPPAPAAAIQVPARRTPSRGVGSWR